jgi:SAM-dependent methyltransferase
MSRQQHWESIYRDKAHDAVSWFQAIPQTSLDLIRRTGAPRDARVIDVGAGTSALVDALLREGWRHVAALDLSATALAAAQARLGEAAAGVEWFVTDVTTFVAPHAFDIWHDRAAFHFLTEPHDRARYVEILRRSLAPRGHVIIAAFAPDGPERCSSLPVRRYDAALIRETFGPGFVLHETFDEQHRTPAGATQHFLFHRLQVID